MWFVVDCYCVFCVSLLFSVCGCLLLLDMIVVACCRVFVVSCLLWLALLFVSCRLWVVDRCVVLVVCCSVLFVAFFVVVCCCFECVVVC